MNRLAIARHVFAADAAGNADRRFLENLTHPLIRNRLKSELAHFAAEGRKAIVLDAALLFEADWQTLCDLVVFVDSSRESRLRRARARGWSDADFAAREAAQWPIEDKRRAANIVLNNDGTEADLSQAVAEFWDQHISAARHVD